MEEYRDNNNDGVVDVKYTNTLDANGHVIEQATDVNNDGVVDKVERYTLDAEGRPAIVYTDTTNNGSVDTTRLIIRDANGNIIRQDTYLGDSVKAKADAVITYDVDANGRVVEQFNDSDGDGTVNSRYTFDYDTYGNVLIQGNDTDNDGVLNTTNHYTYDANGNKLTYWQDKTNNGQTGDDRYETYQYDDLGRVSVREVIDNGNSYNVYPLYDSQNRIIATQFDYAKDGYGTGDNTQYSYYDDVLGIATSGYREFYNNEKPADAYWKGTSNANGQRLLQFADMNGDGIYEIFGFGDTTGRNSFAHTEDMTQWSVEQLKDVTGGLTRIYLSDVTASSTLTIDKTIASKVIGTSPLTISGDATDTVVLKGFTAADKLTETVSSGGHTYDKYQFTDIIDGTTVNTIVIDSDINVTFG